MNTQEIRKLLEQDKLIIGHNEVKQAVADQSVERVMIASNAMHDYCEMADIECQMLETRNDQVGTTCRKPFSISFLAVKA